ncbi:MAG TPA: transcription elongation factor GreA [Candidatus Hydrogenedentes bacterium]|nr:transcription elongation factor GreA [Candidatus Hydrogenedentota bacterium]HOL76601.1 transcription elongation factor GreA [Candidatus Hydrogenedentota bacterium]HPO84434.1 transcription elongation factor GreA [Candidatus Hydrogenedentota bacterium]
MDKIHVTREGLERLKAELAECRAQTRIIADEIEHARSYGDLSENAEYHAAKEAQAKMQARIRDLEDKIARAVIIDDSRIDGSRAYVGATVRVRDRKKQREYTYVLVSPVEADIASGKISIKSPVGQALSGKQVGEIVKAKVPAGELELEILEISR